MVITQSTPRRTDLFLEVPAALSRPRNRPECEFADEFVEVDRHRLDRLAADGIAVTGELVLEDLGLPTEGDRRIDESDGFVVLRIGTGDSGAGDSDIGHALHSRADGHLRGHDRIDRTGLLEVVGIDSGQARFEVGGVCDQSPRTTAEAPGTSTSEATNRPPVSDSADASEIPS